LGGLHIESAFALSYVMHVPKIWFQIPATFDYYYEIKL